MGHPGHTTTLVLPVFEIEQVVLQLNRFPDTAVTGSARDVKATKQIRHRRKYSPMFMAMVDLVERGPDLAGVANGVRKLDDDALFALFSLILSLGFRLALQYYVVHRYQRSA